MSQSNLIAREPAEEVDRAAVFKQRRLLLSFSFGLAAIHGLDVELSGNVSAQGLVLTFQHPSVLVVALWCAWAWSFWRYWQYEHTYRTVGAGNAIRKERNQRALAAATAAIHEAIDRGDYANRGLKRGDRVDVGGELKLSEGGEWSFPNLTIRRYDEQQSKVVTVDGGANCTLNRKETLKINRAVARAVFLKHPFFADFKIAYWLALVAPIAGLVDLLRWASSCWARFLA